MRPPRSTGAAAWPPAAASPTGRSARCCDRRSGSRSTTRPRTLPAGCTRGSARRWPTPGPPTMSCGSPPPPSPPPPGCRSPAVPWRALEPEEVGDQIARAWPRFVTALAGRGPSILLFEDLHWADDQLLEIVRLIATRSHGPVLIVATARPEFAGSHPAFADGIAGSAVLALEPLSDEQSEHLVAGLLVGAELPGRSAFPHDQEGRGQPAVPRGDGPTADRRGRRRSRGRWLGGARRRAVHDAAGHGARGPRRADRRAPAPREASAPGGVRGGTELLGGAARPHARASGSHGRPRRARGEGPPACAARLELRGERRAPLRPRADPGRRLRIAPDRATSPGTCRGRIVDDRRRGRSLRGGRGADRRSLRPGGHRRRGSRVVRGAGGTAGRRARGVRRPAVRRVDRPPSVRGATRRRAPRGRRSRWRPRRRTARRPWRPSATTTRRRSTATRRWSAYRDVDLAAPRRSGRRRGPRAGLQEGGGAGPRPERRIQFHAGTGHGRRAGARGAVVRIGPGGRRLAPGPVGRGGDLVAEHGRRGRLLRGPDPLALGRTGRGASPRAARARGVRPGVPLRGPHGERLVRAGRRTQPRGRGLRPDLLAGPPLAGSRRDRDLGSRRRGRARACAGPRDAWVRARPRTSAPTT